MILYTSTINMDPLFSSKWNQISVTGWYWPTAVALIACVLLISCSKENAEGPARVSPENSAEAPPSKVLLPIFAAVGQCLSSCISTWWKVEHGASQQFVPKFKPNMPLTFAELISRPEDHARFIQIVDKFPRHLQSIGKLQPGDEEKLVDNGAFGSYKKEQPKMAGDLYNVINSNGRIIYVYASVYYLRYAEKSPGTMQVAIDPLTHEYASVVRAGADLDEYYLAGADSLRSTLLAFTVAKDLETAEMLAHYENKNQGTYETKPIMLPLSKSLEEALVRVELLNDRLGEVDHATGVPAPGFLQKAMTFQAENTWYGVAQGRDRCIESPMSPAHRIDLIKETGIVPRIRDTTSNGKLTAVEVSAVDGGNVTSWRFFKNKTDCEHSLPFSAPTPEKYR